MRRHVALRLALLALAGGLGAPALAQPAAPAASPAEPWRAPVDQPGTQAADNKARISSGAAAVAPSPAEQREAKALAGAIFATPAAAQKAADKAAPEQPLSDLAEVQPRPEWARHKPGVDLGGRGVRVQTPF
ncbi:MAG: hypothetical protein ACJ798_02015 [Phenylobacterium sp.]